MKFRGKLKIMVLKPEILNPNGSIKFPYTKFPWRLEHDNKVCHFECVEHLRKYIDKYGLKPKDIIIGNKYGESFVGSKKYEKDLRQKTTKSNNRSAGTVRKRISSVDTIRNPSSNRKKKK